MSSIPARQGSGLDHTRIGGYLAIAAVAVGFGGVFAALAVSPWFAWTQHALSDLGSPSRSSALLFNGGLILAGALYLEFVYGLYKARFSDGALARAGTVLLAGGAVFLMGVGIAPIGNPAHFGISLGYFFLYPPGVIVFGVGARKSHTGFLHMSVSLAAVALVFGLLQFTPVFSSQAIPEMVLTGALSLWSAIVGFWMVKGKLAAPAPGP